MHQSVDNHVRDFRTRLGLTQAQLAEKVGVARVSIVAIEQGRYIPTIETALRISRTMGVPLEELFSLKDGS